MTNACKLVLVIMSLGLFIAGCGTPKETKKRICIATQPEKIKAKTVSAEELQASENRSKLFNLNFDMTKDDVFKIMGKPYKTTGNSDSKSTIEIWDYIIKKSDLETQFSHLTFINGKLKSWD